ncbi:sugar kinase [Streptomyces sp. NBC_00536]|uniref:sugar kinase n=1 Tax=Streptomyces sp. NBC_00536 TaxID=2975769 RepID=UPI002E81B551|nr:sugar kinase [Streptomyces sp. NBC_00536]WUC77051.1 sugar kinase [Streptomyces sp. NBC_00536]
MSTTPDGRAVDVTCLGESMVALRPTTPGPLAGAGGFTRGFGGAESNVACGVAGAGHSARWVGRVGADGFGDYLVREMSARGVDTSHVTRDRHRPTGIYFRTVGERATRAVAEPGQDLPPQDLAEVAYYREGSAASAMSPHTVDTTVLDATRVLHLTGITAALSPGCLDLLRALTAPRPGRPLISFDVNYRMNLWPDAATAGPVLLALARASDLVFVGADEAEVLWGTGGGLEAVRRLLPEPKVLVVKQGADGATVFTRTVKDRTDGPDGSDLVVHEPAPAVAVVASVGAGDAFAAGFLSAGLRGLPVPERIRHGHLTAASVLTSPEDLAAPPPRQLADRLAALDAPAWRELRLAAGWAADLGAHPQKDHPQKNHPRKHHSQKEERHTP